MLGLPAESRLSLDDPATLRLAASDPVGLLDSLPHPTVIDEFQRAGPDLLLAVKRAVDRDRRRGQFVLTGSASYLAGHTVTETLAGRAGRLVLWPLSAGERRGHGGSFLDDVNQADWEPPRAMTAPFDRASLVEELLVGGYPEVVTDNFADRARTRWFDSYVHDVISREALRPVADVRQEPDLRRVMRLLAVRSSGEVVAADLARDANLDRGTATRYVALLEALYLIVSIPAFATSATTRAKRSPKIVVADSGLAAHLTGAGRATLGPAGDAALAGGLFKTFVVTELARQATWSESPVDLLHFRDRNGAEVDLILEDRRSGHIVGVAVKLTATPKPAHARHLAMLRDRLPDRFVRGLVVHTGPRALALGERLWAVPVAQLWG